MATFLGCSADVSRRTPLPPSGSTPGAIDRSRQDTAPPIENDLPKFGEYVYVEELPEAITKIAPAYPEEARSDRVQGTVIVQALVGTDGTVKDIRIVNSIPTLDEAAADAVRRWVFKPALTKGRPVAVWVAVPVKFSLH